MLTAYKKRQIKELYKGKIKTDFILKKLNITRKEFIKVIEDVVVDKPTKEGLIIIISEAVKKERYTLSELCDTFETSMVSTREAARKVRLVIEDLSFERKLELIRDVRSNFSDTTIRERYYLSRKEIKRIRMIVANATKKIEEKISSNTKEIQATKARLSKLLRIEKQNDLTLKRALREITKK